MSDEKVRVRVVARQVVIYDQERLLDKEEAQEYQDAINNDDREKLGQLIACHIDVSDVHDDEPIDTDDCEISINGKELYADE